MTGSGEVCPECGGGLAAGSTSRLCSRCLLRLGLDATEPLPSTGPGESVGPYRLIEVIGEGGMGRVYLAEQTEPLRRRVALKVIKLGMDTRDVIARFQAERQALALMDHPNIAKVLDAGATERGSPYFVMEYVPGLPITRYCDEHRLGTRDRLQLFRKVCDAVQHAHQKGVIHRDLKPSNILVSIQDDGPVPRIIDFGVAKATGRRLIEDTVFTRVGQMIGTPEYMSPEQADPAALDIDTRADVYALGVVLYELLVGELPFSRQELLEAGYEEIRRRIREEDPPRPSTRVSRSGPASVEAAARRRTDVRTLRRDLQGDLDWIVMMALEKDRARRYTSAAALADDLQRHLTHEPVVAGSPGAAYRAQKFVRRHRVGVGFAAVVLLLLASLGIVMAAQASRIARERDRANLEADRARREAVTAERISEFLVSLFDAASPDEARGAEVGARELLDRGARRIDLELGDEPEIRARLLAEVGKVYGTLGLLDESESFLRRAIDLQRRQRPADEAAIAESLRDLGLALQEQGDYGEAKKLYLEAREIVGRTLGLQNRRGAELANDLGVIALYEGNLEEGETLIQEAVDIDARLDDGDMESRVNYTNNLSMILGFQGRLGDMELLLRDVVELGRRELGPDHPATLLAIANLGAILGEQGKYAEAEPYYQEALTVRRRVLGDDHPDTLNTLSNMAWLLGQQGRNAEAERVYAEAIEGWTRVAGEDHEVRLRTISNLGDLLTTQGRIDEALELLADASERARRALPADSATRAAVLAKHGICLIRHGRLREAEPLLLEAYRVVEAARGKEDPTAQRIIRNLVEVYDGTDRRPEAEEWRGRLAPSQA